MTLPAFSWQSGWLEFTADVRLNQRHHFMVFTLMRLKAGVMCAQYIWHELSDILTYNQKRKDRLYFQAKVKISIYRHTYP